SIDFYLSESRDKQAAKRFFKKALAASHICKPRVITVDKNPAYPVAIQELKEEKRVRTMLGLKSYETATSILSGVETMHMMK
ncbi:DDE-type integrase/transposase/recombinase, partial [Bacillus sp. TL12]|uniref:DDE-type integrase/transposase/recombinase n=1 Tax=Bacillus sp. TL12 TaxID=2894756 RepID=UPI001F516715